MNEDMYKILCGKGNPDRSEELRKMYPHVRVIVPDENGIQLEYNKAGREVFSNIPFDAMLIWKKAFGEWLNILEETHKCAMYFILDPRRIPETYNWKAIITKWLRWKAGDAKAARLYGDKPSSNPFERG